MIARHGPQVTATNIQTDIKKLEPVRVKVEEEYDFLSEHTHPAGFGTILYFAEKLKDEDVYVFNDGVSRPRSRTSMDFDWHQIARRIRKGLRSSGGSASGAHRPRPR